MALFGIGGSKQKAQSTSWSEGQSGSTAGGYNVSGGASTGRSISGGSARTDVFAGDALQRLIAMGEDRLAGGIPFLTQSANDLYSSGRSLLGNLSQVSSGADPSGQFLQSVMQGINVDEDIEALRGDIGAFLEYDALPQVRSAAGRAGQFGSTREGVAQGRAIGDASRAFATGASQIRQDARNQQLQAAGMFSGNVIGAGTAGGQLGGDLYGLAEASEFGPLMAMRNLIGDNTISSSDQYSVSEQDAWNQAVGENWSDAWAWDRAGSQSTSKGVSFNIGGGK